MKLSRFCQIAFVTILLSAGAAQVAAAQKGSFIYLQSDEQQPFYVTVNGRNISSSSIGYVILSKVPDGSLPLRIGFPNSNTVQDYDLKVAGNDQGYLIKNFGEKGWGLFNLQSLDVQISGVELAKRSKETAAQKAAEQKRVADSVAVEVAKADAIRKADSIKNALAAQELEVKRLDSLRLVAAEQEAETQRLDSIKTAALAEEKAKADEIAAAKAAAKIADSTAKATTAAAKKKAADDKKKPATKQTKNKEVAAKKTPAETPAKEITTAAVVAGEVVAGTAAAVAAEKEQPKKKPTDTKKEPVAKIDEAVTDSGKLLVYKDGKDTVKAYLTETTPANEPAAADDTIVIKIPARPKKAADSIVVAQETTQEIPEKKTGTLPDKKFLDIEINHDSALVKPEIQPATKPEAIAVKVDTVVAPSVSSITVVDSPKQVVKGGLTPNNSNTKIVLAPTIDSAAKARQKETQPVADAANDTSKGKKTVGLTSNNPNTKIVVVPPVISEPAPADKPKAETVKTEVITAPVEKAKVEEVKTDSVVVASAVPASSNLACKEVATEKDFFNVRKSMVMGADADEMIMAGKKAFKEKCYSTAQIRNLCVLFLSDADRYSFLDAAYPYTSDAANYASLSDLLKESYYLNRFKAMLK